MENFKIDNENTNYETKIQKAFKKEEIGLNKSELNELKEQKELLLKEIKILSAFEKTIPNYDIDIKYGEDGIYLEGKSIKGNETYTLNFPIKNKDDLKIWLSDLRTLLNEERKLILTGKQDFRRIIYGNTNLLDFLKENRDKKLVYSGIKPDRDGSIDINYATTENNYLEELYKFVQHLKGVPEKKWAIKNGIGKPEDIGFENVNNNTELFTVK